MGHKPAVNTPAASIIALSILLFLSQNIYPSTWQNAVIMGGGFVSGLAYSPVQQNLLYARTDVGGLYRWNNSISQWVPLTDMFTGSYMGGESITPDPVDPNVVYAAVGFSGYGNILRSSDQGNSWTVYPVAVSMAANNDGRQAGERLAVDPNLPSKLYFGSRWQGLWVSTNSAATWSKVTAFPANGDAGYGISWVIFPEPAGGYGNPSGTASQTIYAGTASLSSGNSNVYRSTNGGTSWAVISGGPSSMTTPHASLGTDGYLWAVFDGGGYGPSGISSGQVWKLNTSTLAWTNVTPSNGPGAGAGGYGDVCVDAQNPQHAILSTIDWWGGPDKILQTVNGGTSWTYISVNNVGWNAGPFSVFDLNGANWGYGCGGNPGGAGWAGNAKIDPFNSNNAIYTSGSGPGGGGVWSSTNLNASSQPQGITWVFSDKGLEETVSIYMPTAVKGGILFSCLGDIDGMRHTDLTQSPSSGIYCNPQFSNTNCLDLAENNTNIVVRAGNSGSTSSDVGYSTNNGQTWSPWGSAPPGYTSSNQMGSVAVAADGSAVVVSPYSGYGSPAYATSPGGTWTTCSGLPSGAWVASDRVTASTFYAASPSQWVFGGTVNIYRSTDYGKTFTQVNSISVGWSDPNGNGQYVVPRPVFGVAGEFWVSTYNALYRFTNGGTSVSTISNVYEPMGPVGFGKAASGQSHPAVYLIGTVNGTYGFFRCDDGAGTAWTRINDDSHQFGGPGWIQGDQQIYGRCYLGAGARGILYCDSASTGTPTPTATWTPPTGTFTPTLYISPTFTRTLTPSSTVSVTRTFTPSYTVTSMPSSSSTPTMTATSTSQVTATYTGTMTVTPVPTNTFTPTFTATRTYTATVTATSTVTLSSTIVPSITASPTGTPPTQTATFTPAWTFTAVLTASATPSGTWTGTATPAPSFTATATVTVVPSASVTFTSNVTPSVSATQVFSATATPENSATMTAAATVSNTQTATPTITQTATRSMTQTYTPGRTATRTFTVTQTRTATVTNTVQPTITFTPTVSPVPEGAAGISVNTAYPNPVTAGHGISFDVKISGNPACAGVRIYTTAYRKVFEKKKEWMSGVSAPECVLSIAGSELAGLSNGIYYCVLTMEDTSGGNFLSKPYIIVILR